MFASLNLILFHLRLRQVQCYCRDTLYSDPSTSKLAPAGIISYLRNRKLATTPKAPIHALASCVIPLLPNSLYSPEAQSTWIKSILRSHCDSTFTNVIPRNSCHTPSLKQVSSICPCRVSPAKQTVSKSVWVILDFDK